ncbi:MAG: DUF2461 domain-containing protein [Candidatus Cloacimonadota bacterium]|nr:MAG: DUF2461 domain-containing protein [Candidatus Cloacimonadota bacterium]
MSSTLTLKDFPKRTTNFLNKLSKNNNREWYLENKDIYNSDFLEPLIYFVEEMGNKLLSLDPEITAIPRIDKSIFRLHRDVRFSKNKEPYKTNAGILFWNSKAKKMESCGFYFHLEPKKIGVGVGTYIIPKHMLKTYRDAVADPVTGQELNRAVKKIEKNGLYKVLGKNYKRIPKGYDPDSPYADYLLHSGMFGWYESKNIKELYDGNAVDIIYKIFKDMLPLHKWLAKYLLRSFNDSK